MNIDLFTNVGSLFDERRGIITKVAIESGNTKFDWNTNFSEIYARRRFDYFNQPELGITQEKYLERFAKRSIEDFADHTQAFIRPSKLIHNMFKIVREIEFGVGQMLSVSTFSLTVNIYPYVIEGELLDELASTIRGAIPFNISLSFVDFPYEKITPAVLHSYQYVFLYDFMCTPHYEVYWKEYPKAQPSNVKFIIPDVLAKSPEELPEEMRREEPIELLGKMNATQGGKITWVPYPKTIFDYKE
ncbi:hypothetical protein OBP_270 [Pseudomonas phage OBP]|uniref:hypothetical protein n=1 Tax=Pseudomonas phage OBP TaxID=1124849 RepID=UPI000240D5F7|nr:hypothetical protein OBP_270 [Pseudomonas phage OBP]AEV89707.1 hypothetical protein OBP_270 [Pseudomonas phage OBP]